MAIENDVDLYKELKDTLEAAEVEEPVEASLEKPQEKKVDAPATEVKDEQGELSEDDISKLSPRAQKRIREQADEIKRLAELGKQPEKASEKPAEKPKESPQDFKNVSEFLNAVEDEPSRKLLEKFYGVIKNETSAILAPIEQKNAETKFESEFSQYEKVEGLSDYKNDLKKTFLRNPDQSFKALIGEVIADLTLSKVKPIETTPSTPNRDGKVNTDSLSKDQLYDMLDTMKE